MAGLLRVDGATATSVNVTSMNAEGLLETEHLEAWIVAHSEVLGTDLMIVATQYDEWEAEIGAARERPDILALSSSGQLVVIELKRGGDRRVHLQVLTYGALAAKFDLDRLAGAHFRWLAKRAGPESVTESEARQRLLDHVDGDWREDVLHLPKLVIVAEAYPPQVLTTVNWLSEIAPALSVECHEVALFEDAGRTYAAFSQIFPVDDLSDRILRPASLGTNGAAEEIAERTRRARSVAIIYEHKLIPAGTLVTLEMDKAVRAETAEAVRAWLDENPARTQVHWADHPTAPLRWRGEGDPSREWTLSRLRDHIFEQAGRTGTSSAADLWHCKDQSIYWVAQNWVDSQEG